MKLDVTQKMKTRAGETMTDSAAIKSCPKCGTVVVFPQVPNPEADPVTLRAVIVNSLDAAPGKNDGVEDGVARYRKGKLAGKVMEHDAVDLTADEITLVKTAVGKLYLPLVVSQAWDMMEALASEPEPSGEDEKEE